MTKNLNMQLKTANIDEDIVLAKEHLENLKEAQKTALEEVSDEDNPRTEDINQRITKQQQQLLQLMTMQHDKDVLEQKGKVLTTTLKRSMSQKVMKKAAFWQCVLTVLTYIIFALNTIITGFGLANLAQPEP